jgi:hypothetical protein
MRARIEHAVRILTGEKSQRARPALLPGSERIGRQRVESSRGAPVPAKALMLKLATTRAAAMRALFLFRQLCPCTGADPAEVVAH